jgi:hypothetical protein
MGHYIGGDCTDAQKANPNHKCYNIFRTIQGNIYRPPTSDHVFEYFANDWEATVVDDYLENTYDPNTWSINYIDNPNYIKKHSLSNLKDGRSVSFDITDASYYDGDCKDDLTKIAQINETCKINTVEKYDKCCKEIGICQVLWKACIEDLCSCTAPDSNNPLSEDDCLNIIVHESMNTTCSYDELYPTASPTGAPTKQPTGQVNGLPINTQSQEDLIWLYLVFVVLFVILAGAAYWYYRRKSLEKHMLMILKMDNNKVMHLHILKINFVIVFIYYYY